MMIFRLQLRERTIISAELAERLRHNNGQIESVQVIDGEWLVEARFEGADTTCPACAGSQTRRYGWRKAIFNDCPATDGLTVRLAAWRPRMSCDECGKKFVSGTPYLLDYGRITLGMQRHLAQGILHYPSIRELARATRLSTKTVMFALKAAIADPMLHQGPWDRIAIRSLKIRRKAYWLAIDPLTLKTKTLIESDKSPGLENLAIRVAELSPSEIDLPINPELATLLKAELPLARLTISIPEMCDLTEDILRDGMKRLSYKLRDEGLMSERARKLCSTRLDSLPQAEQLLLSTLSRTAPFWGSYQFKEYFHSLLEAGNLNYRQAIQESLECAIEAVRPMFVPVYRQLIQLDQLGVELQRNQEYEQVQSKLNRLRARLKKQGARFEFPLLSAIVGLFFLGFGGPDVLGAFEQSLVELRDLVWIPSSFWLSDVERQAILLA